jgi:hypothetical protein
MSTEQIPPPLPLAEINVPEVTVDAAYAEGEVWNAAALLVKAGVVPAELMQSPALREAATAASSALLRTEVVGPTVYAEISDLFSGGETKALPTNPYEAISSIVGRQLSTNKIRHNTVNFTGEEVAAFQQEGVYAAMDIHTIRQDFSVQEVLNPQADASEFRITTVRDSNGYKYRMEYTVGARGVMYRQTSLTSEGVEIASSRPRTGRLETKDFIDLCTDMSKGGIVRGRIWGSWADMAESGPAPGQAEYDQAVTDLHATSIKVLTDAGAHGVHALPEKEAKQFERQGLVWALRIEPAPTDISSHQDTTTVTYNGHELVITKRLFLYSGKDISSVMEDVYVVGSQPTHIKNSYRGKRSYSKGVPDTTYPRTLQTADVIKLAKELNDINLPEVQVWQRKQR